MSSHENYTPIKILHNSAGHLVGSARSLGGVVVGYLGVRVFCPRPVATMVQFYFIKWCPLISMLCIICINKHWNPRGPFEKRSLKEFSFYKNIDNLFKFFKLG